MQEYNAKIKIENRQKSEDGDEIITQNLPCRFMYKGGKAYILYKAEGVSSKIRVEGNRVTVTRMGEFSNEMVYITGERRPFLYKMPYGEIEMELATNSVFVDLDENGGEIRLSYKLLFSGTENRNDLRITISV